MMRADMTFVQDEGWYAANACYEAFAKKTLGKKTLYLELTKEEEDRLTDSLFAIKDTISQIKW